MNVIRVCATRPVCFYFILYLIFLLVYLLMFYLTLFCLCILVDILHVRYTGFGTLF